MAAKSKATTDHDRIVMPSRKADGSLDQTDPEFIHSDSEKIAKEQEEAQATYAADAVEHEPDTPVDKNEGGSKS